MKNKEKKAEEMLDKKLRELAEIRNWDSESEAFEGILKLAERQAFSPHFVALCVSEYLINEEE